MAQATISVAPAVTDKSEQLCAAAASAATYSIHDDVGEVLFTKQQMAEKVVEMGKLLGKTYEVGYVPSAAPCIQPGAWCANPTSRPSVIGCLQLFACKWQSLYHYLASGTHTGCWAHAASYLAPAWLLAVVLLSAAVPCLAHSSSLDTLLHFDSHAPCMFSHNLQGKAPVLMPILKGGFIFAADLIRALDPCPEDLVVEFVSARWAVKSNLLHSPAACAPARWA